MPTYYVHHPDKGTTVSNDVLDALPEMRRLGRGACVFDEDGVLLASLPLRPKEIHELIGGFAWGAGDKILRESWTSGVALSAKTRTGN